MKNVLVVDNSDVLLKLMSNILTKLGHNVKTAEDGITALELMEDFRPQIIFIDLVMPNLDGDKLCRVIRNNDKYKDSFIAILSAIAAEEGLDCTKFGANICIAKGPYGELKSHVASVIDLYDQYGPDYQSTDILGLDAIYKREITKELLFSKSHFEITLAHLKEGFIELNQNNRIIYANEAATKLLGRSAEDLLSTPIIDSFPDYAKDKVQHLLDNMGSKVASIGEDFPIKCNNRQMVFNFLPVVGQMQDSTIVMIHDVTERKRLEEELQKHHGFLEELVSERNAELRQSENNLTQAQQIANLGNWEYDLDTGEMVWSWETYRILGHKQVTNTASMQSYLKTILPCDREFIENSFRDRQPLNIDRELVRPDGRQCIVHEQTEVISGDDGQPMKIIGIIQDITKRKEVEEALRESEEKYRQLFNENSDAVVIFDVDTLIVEEINQAAEQLLGCHRDDIQEKKSTDFFLDAKETNKFIKKFKKESQDSVHLPEKTVKKYGGGSFPAEIHIGSFVSQNKKKIIASIRDTTLRKKLEQELSQAQKMEAIGTLAGGIAHDFNNILTAIMGHSEVALALLKEDKRSAENMREILKASSRAKELVKQILTFSRLTDKSPKPLEIQYIIKEVLKLIRASTPSSIEIRDKINPNCGTIMADPTQIHQLVINLCSNAIDAMQGKGLMEMHLQKVKLVKEEKHQNMDIPPGEYVKLSIFDSGCGIDGAIKHRIFEPFFTTKDIGRGTGLGLSMVHGIVKDHDGIICVESEKDKGSAFHVYFPASREKIEKYSILSEPLPTGSERILFVDDEESILNANRVFLSRLGYKVTTKSDPQDALLLFEESSENFDLVITDQAMPVVTGDEMAKKMLKIRPDLPIILVTGYSSMIDENEAKGIGICEFIMKPISPTSLARRVRKVMDEE